MTVGIHARLPMGGGFTLRDFTDSRVATRYGLYNVPRDVSVVANLKALAEQVLVPLEVRFKRRVTILSAYRTETLNRLLGGVRGSAHVMGEGADILITGIRPADAALTTSAMDDLPFDQLVLERRYLGNGQVQEWLHISHRRMNANRGEVLSAETRGGVRQVCEGLGASVFELAS